MSTNFDLDAGHNSLLSKQYGVDPATGNPSNPKRNTIKSKKFHASQELFESSARLSDAQEVLILIM